MTRGVPRAARAAQAECCQGSRSPAAAPAALLVIHIARAGAEEDDTMREAIDLSQARRPPLPLRAEDLAKGGSA